MGNFYTELTIVICLAAFISIVFRFLKQPPVLAYILTGIILGPLALLRIQDTEVMRSLAEIGITLLLFMLGLELRFSELKSVGKISIITGIGQIVFTTVIGFIISTLLGFSPIAALYISIALTFSSTIIIVKLLSDKKDLNSLYGKISVGFLLVQDFVAIIALIFLSGFGSGSSISYTDFILISLKAIVLFGWVIVLSKKLLPYLINKIAHSSETLFLFSLAWAFGIAAVISSPAIGFSIEIGGFLAGLALANSYESYQIITKIRPLRDFFITIFFVTLGMGLLISDFSTILIPGIILSLFVLIGNPLIVMILMGLLGYKKRTGFLAGLTVAQISEFSLIVMFMGSRIGHVTEQNVALITFVGAVTFVVSTYMILNGNTLYKILSPYLGVFERKNIREKNLKTKDFKNHIVLIGARRMGEGILEALLKNKEEVVVVDFDPDIIEKLKKNNVEAFFGDISDTEIQELASLEKARLVISTVSDTEDNLLLLQGLKKLKKKPKTVMLALEKNEAKELYDQGADYVVVPHIAGGNHLAKILVDENHMELIEEYASREKSYIS
ncbi:MAG: Transporter, CPA2 family [Microgenomates group bacterium GW2011_GWA2_37_6]|nr:MAG: Transporter, CPA2 family [Microgenomates group bacterium GW2011_GWA2_37_6]